MISSNINLSQQLNTNMNEKLCLDTLMNYQKWTKETLAKGRAAN